MEELDGLPLALSTAGAYLKRVAMDFSEYLQLYRTSWLRLQKMSPGLEDRALHSTWNISYEQVERENTRSAMLLRLWAYFSNDDLWFELLREGHATGPLWFRELTDDMLEFHEAVRVLCNYGLAEPDMSSKERGIESRGYSMHSCVHMWTLHVLNQEQDVEMARLAMRCVGAHVPANTEQGYWVVERRLIQHGDRCLATQVTSGISTAEDDEWIPYNLGLLYNDQGRLDEAEAMYDRALQGYERALGPEHTSTLRTVNNLGVLYKDQGRLDEAEAMYGRALQGYERALGPERVNCYVPALNAIQNLADLYVTLERPVQARVLYEQCKAGIQSVFGRHHDRYQQVTQQLILLEQD